MVDVPTPTFQAQGQGVVSARDLNSTVQACQNLAQMRGLVGIGQAVLFLEGYTSQGDGGQGLYGWNSTATGPDNGTTVIQPTGVTVGAWVLLPLGGVSSTTSCITYVIDGSGSVIGTGVRGQLSIPFACTITSSTLLADQTGSVVLDIWKTPFASYPPTIANSIVAADFPTITSAQASQDVALTGWTTAISAGDTLMFNVNSATSITRLTLALAVTK